MLTHLCLRFLRMHNDGIENSQGGIIFEGLSMEIFSANWIDKHWRFNWNKELFHCTAQKDTLSVTVNVHTWKTHFQEQMVQLYNWSNYIVVQIAPLIVFHICNVSNNSSAWYLVEKCASYAVISITLLTFIWYQKCILEIYKCRHEKMISNLCVLLVLLIVHI
jgi:hypothetical protein